VQIPLLIGALILGFLIIALVLAFLLKSRYDGKKLVKLVEERTKELEQQKATLTTIINAIPDLLYVKDLDLRFTYINTAMQKMYDIETDITGKKASDVKEPDSVDKDYDALNQQVLDSGQMIKQEEPIQGANGESRIYETIRIPVMVDGVMNSVLGMARDITSRKNMERQLQDNFISAKALSSALAEITKSPAILKGDLKTAAENIARKGCVAANTDVVAVWLYSEEKNALVCIAAYSASVKDFVEKAEYDMLSDEAYVARLLSERLCVEDSISENFPDSYYSHNPDICAMLEAPLNIGGKFYGSVSIEQERNEIYPDGREWTMEEQQFASSLADIMALAISGYERRLAREAAEAESKYKSKFLASMSHEIRMPINNITEFSELAVDGNLPVATRDYLQKIHENANGLLLLINDILDISKIESGKMDLDNIPFDMQDLLESCRSLVMPNAIEKNIMMYISAEPDTNLHPLGDPVRLRQVLVSLLSNAIKFTDVGTVKLVVEIRDKTQRSMTFAFAVTDSGSGMSKEQIARFLDPFAVPEADTALEIDGTGLGLSITKRIVEAMGGDIKVESMPGVGSKFSFELKFDTIDVNDSEFNEKVLFENQKKSVFDEEVSLNEEETNTLLNNLQQYLKDNDPKCLSLTLSLRHIPGSEGLIKQIEGFEFSNALKSLKVLKKSLE